MTDLKKQFKDTVAFVKNADTGFKPSNDLKLQMYALYKQATQGDVTGKKPGFTDVVGKAKYNAWSKIKGMSSEEAMQAYIEGVEENT